MTRDQMKEAISDIIRDTDISEYGEAYISHHDADRVAEEILKLWDQGFVYEISNECDCSEYCDCKS